MIRAALCLVFASSAAIVALACAPAAVAVAQPAIERPVTDAAGVLDANVVAAIEARLHAHREAGHAQIALLVVRSLEGRPIADYALRAAERWGGGSAARDDGALFVLATGDREMRIEIGYGLEESIPDVVAMRILDGLIEPLRAGDLDRAAWQAADALIVRTGGTSAPFPGRAASARADDGDAPVRAAPVAPDPVRERAPADDHGRPQAHRTDRSGVARGICLIAVVLLGALVVFVHLYRSSMATYDSDGRAVPPSYASIAQDLLSALREVGRGEGGGGGAPRRSEPSWDRPHRSERSHRSRSSSSSSRSHGGGGGGSHRSYGGGGGGFGGGGASKRW